MLKFFVPCAFLLLADGKAVIGKEEPAKSATASGHKSAGEVATERKAAEGGGEKPAAKSGEGAEPKRPIASKHDRGDGERAPTPPAGITAHALQDELGQRSTAQKAATERERLEALSADLARARAALREETTRLEGLMEKAKTAPVRPGAANAPAPGAPGTAPAAPGTAPAAPGTPGQPMPLGDPLAPNAYFRPAPPPPNFAVQVEVVSKAMKSMKPEQAAGIIGHLERGLAAEVLQRMRPADAGAILGFLKPEVGAALAAEIVSRPPTTKGKDKDTDKEKP